MTGCGGSRSGALQPRTHDLASLHQQAASHPDTPEPWYQMALVHAATHQYDDAVRALHAALQRSADYEPALTFMAKLFFESGRSVEGVHYFSSRGFEEWSEPVRVNVALLLADAGRTDDARRLLDAARNGAYADAARANLAYVDWLEGEHARAAQELDALSSADEIPAAAHNLALAHLHRGDVEGSAAILEELAQKHPELALASSNLALVLRHWLFEDARADVYDGRALASAPPHLSDSLVYELLFGAGTEDAAPSIEDTSPATDPAEGSPGAAPDEESNDDASH